MYGSRKRLAHFVMAANLSRVGLHPHVQCVRVRPVPQGG
eukprot:SAG11_NODE_27658_length_330_cov_1.108225_1_plen_38_part_10